mgnify:CR=1 FL=1
MPSKPAASKKQESSTKKSVIEYRSAKDISTLFGALGESERSIADMTRVFAELPSSGRLDVGGREKLTTRQKEVLSIISQSQRRADEIVQLIRRKGNL